MKMTLEPTLAKNEFKWKEMDATFEIISKEKLNPKTAKKHIAGFIDNEFIQYLKHKIKNKHHTITQL